MGLYNQVTNDDLKSKLGEIETFVKKVWEGPRLLMGFTDHGVSHSQRLIFHIDNFLADKVKGFSQDEAFVLLAACWLHDIAMQDYGLLEEENPNREYTEPLSRAERDFIRKRHASRIKDILESSERQISLLGADHRHLIIPPLGKHTRDVASIVYGHSTEGFSRVALISERPTGHVDPKPFRYDVLAALILLGDECDLIDSRCEHLDDHGLKGLDPISALHLLKHRYIHSSKIAISDENPEHRVLKIEYSWPETQNELRPLYRRWIEGKLLEQINLVQPILSKRLGLEFASSRPISSKTIKGQKVENLPDHVIPFLEAERCRMDLANLEKEHLEVLKALDHCGTCVFVEPEYPGELGAADICKICIPKIIQRCHGLGYRILSEMDVLADPTGCDPQALIERIFESRLDIKNNVTQEDEIDQTKLSRLLIEIHNTASNMIPSILMIRNAHLLPHESKKLLAEVLIPLSYQLENRLFILLTAADVDGMLPTTVPGQVHICRLKMVSKDAITIFLRRHTVHRNDVVKMVIENKEEFTQNQAIILAERFSWHTGDLT